VRTYTPDRIIALEGGLNFRDLGGYVGRDGRRIRWRRLFRSGIIHTPSESDRNRIVRLGIRAVIDLRSNLERREGPHVLGGQDNVHYWAFDHDGVGGNILKMLGEPAAEAAHFRDVMIELYRELPFEFRDAYRQIFQHAAVGPLPLAFNCAAGKDRTGVAAALLLSALGVDWNDILADYLLSEQFIPAMLRAFRSPRNNMVPEHVNRDAIAPVFAVDPAYLEAMREAIEARSGSLENYLLSDLSLEPRILEMFRRRILE
jgi:protein-tyrosine phosphatase